MTDCPRLPGAFLWWGQAVALTRKHDGLIFKYKYSAKQIKDWIAENTARFKVGYPEVG